MRYKTLKRKKLVKAIPDSKTLKEAAGKAGYSHKSRAVYRKSTKEHIEEILQCNPETIKKRFDDIYNRAVEKKDYTNALRAMEALARINGMFIDKSKQDIKVHPFYQDTRSIEEMEESIRQLKEKL